MNDLDIHPSSSQLLLLNVFIWDRFEYTTTFEVNVTACDLENPFIFDNEA